MKKRIAAGWGLFWCFLPLLVLSSLRADERAPPEVAVVLKQALVEKRVVIFTYHGFARTVEPHALGKGTAGKPVLLAWQTDGGSKTEPPPGWRVFLLADIKELTVGTATFAKARPDFHAQKGGRGLKSVESEIATE
ncbi:MAG: WYL domain-containing protein [Opitutaceae bacterium]|jgi:hypothetical protein